ncbi:HNH endonuclease family [Streptococcus pyogenes]|nr:DUF262 domain-containing protein [Streptococcus pyogenes]VHH09567.1 HNH endonuclease family [Streptococcus pyogenes]
MGKEDLQLAENSVVKHYENNVDEYNEKRKLLENTRITKQIWSVLELYEKDKDGILILDPDYQRGDVWDDAKRTAFIESLFMGIIVPPIYVVEVPKKDILDKVRYEVVDGKQRLTSIFRFIKNEIKLKQRSLEYYGDWFNGLDFKEISENYGELVRRFLSQVLDVYVITANSPEFTKYDIFSRLNKGSAPLRVNEIRKAAYHSDLLLMISTFADDKRKNDSERYETIFSKAEIKHYEDLGKFYRAVAMYINSDIEKCIVSGYNSRPREMINTVLNKFQKKEFKIEGFPIDTILEKTYEILEYFNGKNANYYLDSVIKIYCDNPELGIEFLDRVKQSEEILDTLNNSSPSTTTNVNERLAIVVGIRNLELGK